MAQTVSLHIGFLFSPASNERENWSLGQEMGEGVNQSPAASMYGSFV